MNLFLQWKKREFIDMSQPRLISYIFNLAIKILEFFNV